MSSNTFHFACPGSCHLISIGPQGKHAVNHTGDGPYPSLKTLEQRAVSNGSGSSAVTFSDVFQNEVIWGSAVQAAVVLDRHRHKFQDLNSPLHNNLHHGLVDREPVDNSNTILKKALRYAAVNNTELFDHVRDLYVEVGDNHLQVFFGISWLLHHWLDLLKKKVYEVQGRIQDLEMEWNDT